MTHYLIFDIGTKNLAYSLCKINNSKKIVCNRFNMLKCDVIDICGKTICCSENKIGSKKKNVMCKESAVCYKLKDDNNEIVCHEKHNCVGNMLGLCKTHLSINKKLVNPSITFKLNSNPIFNNDFDVRFERLITNLVELFDLIENYYKIKNLIVQIENQPSFLTPQMKTVSVIIYTYFMTIFSNERKILNRKITISNNLITDNISKSDNIITDNISKSDSIITDNISKSVKLSQQKMPTIGSVNFISPSTKTSSKFVLQLKKIYNYDSDIKTFKEYDNRKNFSKCIAKQFFNELSSDKNKYDGNFVANAKYNILEKCDDLADTILYLLYASIFNQK